MTDLIRYTTQPSSVLPFGAAARRAKNLQVRLEDQADRALERATAIQLETSLTTAKVVAQAEIETRAMERLKLAGNTVEALAADAGPVATEWMSKVASGTGDRVAAHVINGHHRLLNL